MHTCGLSNSPSARQRGVAAPMGCALLSVKNASMKKPGRHFSGTVSSKEYQYSCPRLELRNDGRIPGGKPDPSQSAGQRVARGVQSWQSLHSGQSIVRQSLMRARQSQHRGDSHCWAIWLSLTLHLASPGAAANSVYSQHSTGTQTSPSVNVPSARHVTCARHVKTFEHIFEFRSGQRHGAGNPPQQDG